MCIYIHLLVISMRSCLSFHLYNIILLYYNIRACGSLKMFFYPFYRVRFNVSSGPGGARLYKHIALYQANGHGY